VLYTGDGKTICFPLTLIKEQKMNHEELKKNAMKWLVVAGKYTLLALKYTWIGLAWAATHIYQGIKYVIAHREEIKQYIIENKAPLKQYAVMAGVVGLIGMVLLFGFRSSGRQTEPIVSVPTTLEEIAARPVTVSQPMKEEVRRVAAPAPRPASPPRQRDASEEYAIALQMILQAQQQNRNQQPRAPQYNKFTDPDTGPGGVSMGNFGQNTGRAGATPFASNVSVGPQTCSSCRGTGHTGISCFSCNGTGMQTISYTVGSGGVHTPAGQVACGICNGRRFNVCSLCNGTGRR
jgi:hypothetical protein